MAEVHLTLEDRKAMAAHLSTLAQLPAPEGVRRGTWRRAAEGRLLFVTLGEWDVLWLMFPEDLRWALLHSPDTVPAASAFRANARPGEVPSRFSHFKGHVPILWDREEWEAPDDD